MGGGKIEWTEATWNPIAGCTKVSSGCANCYAERMSKRLAAMAAADERAGRNPGAKAKYGRVVNVRGKWIGNVEFDPAALLKPLTWREPRMIFVCSMSDLFQEAVPFAFIDKVFAVMALCPQHTFQVLTKRPERMREYLATRTSIDGSGRIGRCPQWYHVITDWLDEGENGLLGKGWDDCHFAAEMLDLGDPLPNVWLGTSVENQECADERIPQLIQCPAAVRFLSCEPLLGPMVLPLSYTREVCANGSYGPSKPDGIDWVIVGGESGPGARPMNLNWARDIRDQCVEAGVPFFFKQVGGVNKKAAGRLLDGREWNEMPKGGA